jgi:hypothetical protein
MMHYLCYLDLLGGNYSSRTVYLSKFVNLIKCDITSFSSVPLDKDFGSFEI